MTTELNNLHETACGIKKNKFNYNTECGLGLPP